MHKKMVVALLVLAMSFSVFGCGSKETTTPTQEVESEKEENFTQEVESEKEETSTQEIESEKEESSNQEVEKEEPILTLEQMINLRITWVGNEYIDSYGWKFPSNEYGTTGYTDKFVIDENTSDCITHVETSDGTMDFVWSGPVDLGIRAGGTKHGVYLYDSNLNYTLKVWTYGNINDEEFDEMLALDKDTLISYNSIPYVEDGYFNISASDTLFEATFEIANDEDKGYAYYVADKELGTCYQFNYVEKISIYDDTRAKNVIDSIDFATNVIKDYKSVDVSSISQSE